jgi:dolichol-phosphate mannosyltransferase
VVVVTPTYNERDTISAFATQILELGENYDLIVVDDASPDGTGELADELAATFPGRIRVVHRAGKLGYGSAYIEGFKVALQSEAVVIATMDADLSHEPAALPRMVSALRTEECGVVVGSRYLKGSEIRDWPLRRQVISRLGGFYVRVMLGIKLADPTSGFKVFRRSVLEAIDLEAIGASGFGFNIEIVYRANRTGARVTEVPYAFRDRTLGVSKFSRRIITEAFMLPLRLRIGRRGV